MATNETAGIPVVLRATKGRPLTFDEIDQNFRLLAQARALARFVSGSPASPSLASVANSPAGINFLDDGTVQIVSGGAVVASANPNGTFTFGAGAVPRSVVLATSGASVLLAGGSLNTALPTGFYLTADTTGAPDTGSWFVEHSTDGGSYATQTAVASGAGTSVNAGVSLQRSLVNGTWSAWQSAGAPFVDISGYDLNNLAASSMLSKTGTYYGAGMSHTPYGTAAGFHVSVQVNGTVRTQRLTAATNFTEADAGAMFTRTYDGGTWGPWLVEYQEKAWTPRIAGSSSGLKPPAAGNYGWARRIGNTAFVGGTLTWGSGDPIVGGTRMTGLPWPCASALGGGARGGGSLGLPNPGSLVLSAGYTTTAFDIDPGSNYAFVAQIKPGDGYDLNPGVGATGGFLGFQLTYPVDPVPTP